ncbi:beta-mannanase [Streptomyces dangxiongensis]|uniref:Beta-mannanase n=1 Tax=Streptomyces dangxiongensis TaxID=1442032 RepID=A0A3G2JLB8_9ACTN|nr:glycosyl hydrolase [Streptomyces dangxiongensis]AYN43238.1 beta-mannanase [Streptomyces dangxiongensis]
MTAVGRRGALLWALAATASSAAGCTPSRTAPIGAGGRGPSVRTAPYLPFDVTWMIRPKHGRKYLGAAFAGGPTTAGVLDAWAGKAGKAPNLLSYRLSWGDGFPTDATLAVWRRRMLPYLVWEPWTSTLRDISGGRDDAYVRRTAQTVRDLNVPVAIGFAPQMNGDRYPWGTRKAAPAEFVGAWRHLHDLFQDVGVSNVIWVWSPTVAGPSARLRSYHPGDAYVDWLGLVGYYTRTGPHTFDTLFAPAIEEVRAFTRSPVLIAETAAGPGARKPADIADLIRAVTAHRDVVGLVWFDTDKGTDRRIDSSPEALAAFRRGVADPHFGFDVRRP